MRLKPPNSMKPQDNDSLSELVLVERQKKLSTAGESASSALSCLTLKSELPTKTFPTAKAIAWLREIALPEIDRLEMNFLLADLKQI